jgi:hypothetical protein
MKIASTFRLEPAIPEMIGNLNRGELRSESHAALRYITGEDYGYDEDRWRNWYRWRYLKWPTGVAVLMPPMFPWLWLILSRNKANTESVKITVIYMVLGISCMLLLSARLFHTNDVYRWGDITIEYQRTHGVTSGLGHGIGAAGLLGGLVAIVAVLAIAFSRMRIATDCAARRKSEEEFDKPVKPPRAPLAG